MKVRDCFECGCEKDSKYDARFAAERGLCSIAKKNGGKLIWKGNCCDCKEKEIAEKIAAMSLEEAKALLMEMSSYGELRRKMGIVGNALKEGANGC